MPSVNIPARTGEAEITEKKSRFLGLCCCCETEDAAKEILNGIRKKHHEARHVCYAYRIGGAGSVITERAADDGEPQGTAGQPILTVLRGEDLSDCLCAVTRYFGGTLLGTGGLTRAYGSAAKAAVTGAGVVIRREEVIIKATFDYRAEREIRNAIAACGFTAEYGEGVTFDITAPVEEAEDVIKRIKDITRGTANIF